MASKNRIETPVLPNLTELKKLIEQLMINYKSIYKAYNNPSNALARKSFPPDEYDKDAWVKICAMPEYKKLLNNQHFLKALDSYRNTSKPRKALEAYFFLATAFYIHKYLHESEHPDLTTNPIKRTRESAASVAKKLLNLMKVGARLKDLRDQNQLSELLSRLKSEMDKAPEKQKKNDKKTNGNIAAKRLFVKRLAEHFITTYDDPLTSIIKELAMVVGYSPDDRTIEKAVSEVKRAYAKERMKQLEMC